MTYDPKRAWNISATEITFPDNDGYFLYIKVPTAAGENTSEFIVDKGYVVPSRDAGYFICPWGYIHPPVGGSREYSPYWGNRRGAAAAYVYIAYASASDGTGFTMNFNAALDYIAIKATTTPIASPAASDFAGLWKNYKGANGQGVPVGGTTGQKLKKKSNTDYDTEWKDDNSASAPTTITSSTTNSDNGTNHTHALDTVNSNVGTFTTATITVDAKGRVTAASSGSVVSWDKTIGSQLTSTGSTTTTSITPGIYAHCLRITWSIRNENSNWIDDGCFIVWARYVNGAVLISHREILGSQHGVTTSSTMSGSTLNITINWGSTFTGKCLFVIEKVVNGVTN